MIKSKQTLTKALLPRVMRKTDIAIRVPTLILRDREEEESKEKICENNMAYTTIENDKMIRENRQAFKDMADFNLIFEDTIRGITSTVKENGRVLPTLDLIQVQYGEAQAQKEAILCDGFFVKSEKNHIVFALPDPNNLGEYMDIHNYPVSKDELKTYKKCHCIGCSPSSERRNMILAGTETVDWETIINNGSDGFLVLNKGEKKYKQMAKESAKLFQCLAPSVSLGICNRIAILFDNYNNDTFDGMCYGSSEALAEHFYESFGISVHPGACNGMFIQGRIAQGKYGYITIPNRMVMGKITTCAKLRNTPVLEYDWQKIKTVSKDMLDNPNKYDKHVVIIGDKNKPIDIFMDLNVLKSKYDYSKKPEYTVLRVLKNDSVVHFSSTIFAKDAAKNLDKTMSMSYKMFQQDFIESARRNIKGDGRVLGLDTFSNGNIFLRDVLVGAFPEYVRRDANIANDCIKNVVASANSKIQNLGFTARGSGKGITVGPENLVLNEGVLGETEMYNRHFTRMFDELGIPEEHRFVVGYKYPTMDIDEYEIYNTVSLDTIKSRLATRLPTNLSLQKNLEREYYMYQDSIAVMPSYENFKLKHAGSDFDTDMMQFIILLDDEAFNIVVSNGKMTEYEAKIYNDMWHTVQHEAVIVNIAQ